MAPKEAPEEGFDPFPFQDLCQFLQLCANILVEMVFGSLGSFQKLLDIRILTLNQKISAKMYPLLQEEYFQNHHLHGLALTKTCRWQISLLSARDHSWVEN